MVNESTPTIETDRLILRKFKTTDAKALFEILSDKQANEFLPWLPLESLDEAKAFMQKHFLDYYEKPSSYRYAICLKNNNKPFGYVCLTDNESFDFGYGLKKEFWNKGYATEAAKEVIKLVKNAGYKFMTATHDINNPRSGEVMKKLGMQYKYSYVEQCMPKDITVTFRLYQLNFDGNNRRTYMKYWDNFENHFIEENV